MCVSSSGSPARNGLELWLSTAKKRKSTGAFAFNQGMKRFAHQCRLFFQASEALGLGEQVIVERKGSAHGR